MTIETIDVIVAALSLVTTVAIAAAGVAAWFFRHGREERDRQWADLVAARHNHETRLSVIEAHLDIAG